MMNIIDNFKGEYFFLSNFANAPVIYKGITYKNNEAAFQAQKVVSLSEQQKFASLPPNLAKREGRRVKLRPDWELIKKQVMYEIVKAKFEQNPGLRRMLLNTGNAILVEGNTWHDNTWGICKCEKCINKCHIDFNNLGKILMKVREELKLYSK